MQTEAKMEIQASLTTPTPKKGQRQYRLFVSSASSFPWDSVVLLFFSWSLELKSFSSPFA